jgi:hypothetical protein
MCTDVKGIISELQSYLQEYLTIDEIILDELVAKKFLPKAYADPMKSKAKQGNKQEATVDFIGYIGDFYDSKKLAKLCAYFMEKSDYMPRFEEVAKKISHELEVLEITQSDPKRRKTETPSPSYSGTSSVSVSKELSSEDKNSQEMLASVSWQMCPALPVSTKYASAAVNKDYLFVMSKGNSKSSKGYRTKSECDIIYSLQLGTQKWVKMKEFQKPLKSFAVSCDNNYLYVTGGNKCAEMSFLSDDDEGGTNEVLACTSPEDEWDDSIIPKMNNARFCHGANFLDPYLIVAGGFGSDNTIEIINTAKKGQTWFEVGTLPIHMVWPYVTGSHSTVYIGLGCTENYKEPSDIIIGLPRSDLEALATKDKHPDFDNREEIPPPPLQCSALATKNTILIAIGGHVRENERKYPVQSENTCYYFCASDKKWRIMEKSSLTMKRSNPCITSDSNNIYVIGGWMKLENMDKNEPSITYCSAVERGLLD